MVSKKGYNPWNKGLTKDTDKRLKLMSETKKKLYEQGILIPPSTKGLVPWNKGIPHSKETRKKMSLWQLGRNLSEDHKANISKGIKGRILTEKHKLRIGQSNKGRISPMKGRENKWGRHSEETKAKWSKERIGDKNANWQGGKSFEPYTPDFNKAFRESIRERDNHCCVICNRSQEELKYKLHTHHVDYDKLNSFPQNCVSLCRNCHTKTNFNRKPWIIFFQSLLKERYDYKYTIDQKIILDFTEVI